MVSAIFSSENPDIILTSSDDQTVKGWNLNNVKSIKPPNKKRPKTRKKKDGADSDDSDAEDYSDTHSNTITQNSGHLNKKRGFDGLSRSNTKGNMSKIDQENESDDDSVEPKKHSHFINEKKDISNLENTAKTTGKDRYKDTFIGNNQGHMSDKIQNQFDSTVKTNKTLEDFETPNKAITKQLFVNEDSETTTNKKESDIQMEVEKTETLN